tara:strand:- start:2065 stop:3021 length:957 start_codon:yes stop_codon:yes gene_type:complete
VARRDDRISAQIDRVAKGETREFPPEVRRVRSTKKAGELLVKRSDATTVNMKDQFAGMPIFLVLSGPSLRTHNLSLIHEEGAFSFGVNNSWSVHRPTFWTCADPPKKFLSQGWLDPRILKFVPQGKEHNKIRKKIDGKFHSSSITTKDCPNVVYYPRNTDFDHQFFLSEPTVNWGNMGGVKDSLGLKGGRSVMLAAIRLSFYLGFRSIYLLGCDFKMEEGAQNYAFKQERTKGAVNGNNSTYNALIKRFEALKPLFDRRGLSVYNCNKESKLKIFPFRSLEDGIQDFKEHLPDIEDTTEWYETGTKKLQLKRVSKNGK